MGLTFNGTEITWEFLFTDLADPRTSHWPLMNNPIAMLSIVILYNYIVQKLGPALMANRKPFSLRNTLIVYNFLQVLISCYIFSEASRLAWLRDYNWLCQPVDYSNSPIAVRIAEVCYLYFLAKLFELLDTVFFVLRKKDKQISFLHLYHHTVMPIAAWGGAKYLPGGHGTLIGLINSFVHIVMYSYYLLAALSQLSNNIWWKKYVTTMQLMQFCIAFIHSSLLCFIDCGYPRFTLLFTLPNSIFFYFLFTDFYEQAYKKKLKESDISRMKEETSKISTRMKMKEECDELVTKKIEEFS